MLASLASRRAAKAAAVDERLAILERETYEANERLRRLHKLVEDGVMEFDNVLKDRIIAAQPSLVAWAHPEGRVRARPIKRTEP
jgi:hypothetical protein